MIDSRPEEVESSSETPLKRSAEDYVNAANAVIDIAEIAVSFIPGGSAAATGSLQQQNWSGNGIGAAAVAPPERLLVHPSAHTLLHFRAGIRRKEGLLIAQFSDFLPENFSV